MSESALLEARSISFAYQSRFTEQAKSIHGAKGAHNMRAAHSAKGAHSAENANGTRTTAAAGPDSSPPFTIKNFSLTVAPGEFIAIVGASGCGKTTLLKLLGGFLPVQVGQLLWRGRPLQGPDPSRVMVFQEFDQLFPWKRVWGNVEFPLKHAAATGGSERVNRVARPARAARSRRMCR